MTFLIVDDNASMRRMLVRAVHKAADRIWECVDGAEALAAYMDHSPDIVLMDIQMSRVDGLAATKQIVQFDPSARIIIVTDYDDDELRIMARKAGASEYVLKHDLSALEVILGI
jgi:two-component system response regulator DegU